MSEHARDCALVLYASVDPANLKIPLACDCDADEVDKAPVETGYALDDRPPSSTPTATLTGAAATALNAYRKVAGEYRRIKARHDEALAKLTEELAK